MASIEIYWASSTPAQSIENYDFRILSRSEIQPKLMYLFRISFLTTLNIYKAYFKRYHTRIQRLRDLLFFVRSYCVYTPQGFVIKCFLIFIVDEVKNFAAHNICSSCQSYSRTGIRAKDQSQIEDLCIKGKKATTRFCPIGYWSEGLTIGWYFGIGQGQLVRFLILVTA